MYKVIAEQDQVVAIHRDENENIVIDDLQFEVEDLNTGKQYRVVAYSLQDGTDNIRLSFDLWNNEDECFEEIGYGFYDSDGGIIGDSAGEDIEDTELQDKVVEQIFDYMLPTFRTVKNLDEVVSEYSIGIN